MNIALTVGLCGRLLSVQFYLQTTQVPSSAGKCHQFETMFTNRTFRKQCNRQNTKVAGMFKVSVCIYFVFIVLLGLVFMGRHKCEAVACLSSQVKCNFYELFIVHFFMANKFDLI